MVCYIIKRSTSVFARCSCVAQKHVYRGLETILTILSICYIYDMSISHFGATSYVLHVPWTINIFSVFQGLVGAAVQSLFAYRVFRVSHWFIIPILVWLGSFARVTFCGVVTVVALKLENVETIVDRYGHILSASLSIAVFMDIVNSASLTWFLIVNRKSGLARYWSTFPGLLSRGLCPHFLGLRRQTCRIVDKLILYTIGKTF